jgi:hypothetical protein
MRDCWCSASQSKSTEEGVICGKKALVGVGILVGSLQAGPLLGRQEAEPLDLG